jgi:hypothetical protein
LHVRHVGIDDSWKNKLKAVWKINKMYIKLTDSLRFIQ